MSGLTYLFTDIEGSTRLVQELGSLYGLTLRTHRHMLISCVEEHGGAVIRGDEGDGSFFVFTDPTSAVAGALAAQRKIEHYPWPDDLVIRVRMGLHTGSARLSGGEHVGLSVHEAARICAAAHGGQILCSATTAGEVDLTAHGAELRELGSYVLRGISEPHVLVQVDARDLERDFPPPRGAVREGGARVSIWRRGTSGAETVDGPNLSGLVIRGLDGGDLSPGVHVDVVRASSGPADAFRMIVRVDGVIEEEFDGLTSSGTSAAAAIVNRHSTLIRLVETP